MKRIFLAFVFILSVFASASAVDIKGWKNDKADVDLQFVKGFTINDCRLEYEFLYHHGTDDEGFRKDEGGADIYLDGVCIMNVSHKGDLPGDVRVDYKDAYKDFENKGWKFQFIPTSAVSKHKYASNGCDEYDHYYSKLIMTLPASALNKKHRVGLDGTWWCWGAGWSDDKVDVTKDVEANYTLQLGTYEFTDITMTAEKKLSVGVKKSGVSNCDAYLKYTVNAESVGKDETESFANRYVPGKTERIAYKKESPINIKFKVTTKELASTTSSSINTDYYGYPYATIDTCVFDKEDHSVTIKWKTTGDLTLEYAKNGVWRLYRKDQESQFAEEVPITVGNKGLKMSETSFVDKGIEYNKNYTYYICYHHNGWNFDTFDELKDSKADINTSSSPELVLDQCVGDKDRVKIKFSIQPSQTDGFYSAYIYRDNDNYLLKKFENIKAGVSKFEAEDVYDELNNPLSRHQPHEYIVKILQNKYGSPEVARKSGKAAIENYSQIYDFDVSQGTYPDEVRIKWRTTRSYSDEMAESYIIERCEANSSKGAGNDKYKFITRFSTRDRIVSYSDKAALPGVEYSYRVSMLADDNDSIVNQCESKGYVLTVGTIAGRITYPNGIALKGVKVRVQAKSSTETTANIEHQFGASSFETTTDDGGNFIIKGVPYTGDGTTYAITPEYGTHQFAPAQSICYLSQQSLHHSDMNFTDNSAFLVKGKVTYKYGDFPVEGTKILIDGEEAMFDGKPVTTDMQGEYWVEVSPGKHFISVQQDYHDFGATGRFPRATGTYYDFYQNESDVNFVDETLVTIRGRVAGGMEQANLPLAAGKEGGSRANIGRATLMLSPVSNMAYVMNTSETATVAMPADSRVKSHTYLLPYNRQAGVGQAQVMIQTDSITGEFCAKLPPLRYQVLTGSTASVSADSLRAYDLSQINPVLGQVYNSTYKTDKGQTYSCDYHASAIVQFQAPPILDIKDVKHDDGAFGEDSIQVAGNSFEMYEKAADGSINYKLGYPVYYEGTWQRLTLHGYQKYVNADGDKPQETIVPLSKVKVSFSDLSWSKNTKASENTIELDEEGDGYFRFEVGSPLRESEMHERPLQASLSVGNRTYLFPEEPMRAIILGFDMSTAKGFFTTGPAKLFYVLRDPPGSESYTTLEEGSTLTNKMSLTASNTSTSGFKSHVYIGTAVSIPWDEGFKFKASVPISGGIFDDSASSNGTTYADKRGTSSSITLTKSISTGSDANNVGSRGDVYVGLATLRYYGRGYCYDIVETLPDNLLNGEYQTITNSKGQKAYLCASESFMIGNSDTDATFAYTQHYITDELIPEIKRYRNSFILPMGTEINDSYWSSVPDTVTVAYVSLCPTDDPMYGERGYYEVKTRSTGLDLDAVGECNNYIGAWVAHIANNEYQKSTANYDQRVTFASGTTYSESKNYTEEITSSLGSYVNESTSIYDGFALNIDIVVKFDLDLGEKRDDKFSEKLVNDEVQSSNIKTSYTLKDSDGFDNHYVAIHSADLKDSSYGSEGELAYFDGYMFQLLGGNSSRPWEQTEYSKYYNPGQALLNYGTLAVQQPEMWFEEADIVDVPSGSATILTAYLRNTSSVASCQTFNLDVQEGTNTKGLEIMMDGTALGGDARPISIDPGQTVKKTIVLTQTNTDELDYENIKLRMYGNAVQGWEMSNPNLVSARTFSVHFKPSSSPATLIARDNNNIKTSTVNISTGDSIKLEATDYDVNYKGFYKLAMQRKSYADTEWHTIHEWAVNDSIAKAHNIQDVIGKQTTVSYVYNMHELADLTYDFRVVTYAEYGHEDMTRESNVLTIVKDMVAPRLLGAASPKGGVLTADGEISLQFNEDIYSSRIVNANITVSGELNRQETAHQTGLKFETSGQSGTSGNTGISGNAGATSQGALSLQPSGIAVEMWVKNDENETTRELSRPLEKSIIFQHTSEPDGFKMGFTKDKHLWMSAAGQEYVSPEPIKSEGWQYLCAGFTENGFYHYNWYSYQDDKGKLCETVMAESQEATTPISYAKRGRVTVGSDFTGAVSSLMLWNMGKTQEEALADRNNKPTGRENDLVAYWPMNECHGDVAQEVLRSRHLKLPTENYWYSAIENMSAAFNGKDSLTYLAGAAPILPDQDFCLEMWFKTDETPRELSGTLENSKAILFATSSLALSLKSGKPVLAALGEEYELTSSALTANQWHHIAINVQRGSSVNAYIDGKNVRTLPATIVNGVYDDTFVIGKGFVGNIDELRLWAASLTGDAIRYNMYNRVDSTHSGLIFYLPMEKSEKYEGTGVWHTVSDFSDFSSTKVMQKEANATAANLGPNIAPQRLTTSVGHTWVASKDKIVINLNEQLYRIEGTTLQFCVDRIADINGNEIAAPIYWTAFVDKNRLVWKGDTDVEKSVHVFDACEFEAVIANNGSTEENWYLSGIPSWLAVSEESGTIDPLKEQKLTLSVKEGTPVGTYDAVVNLIGNESVHEPMHITVNVTGDAPDWHVNPADYFMSASLITEFDIDGYVDEDENDMVGAFFGDECVGVGHLKYYDKLDRYLVVMNVYGNDNHYKEEVKYRLWDASTGIIYPDVLVKDSEGKDTLTLYRDYSVWGTPTEPFMLKATDIVEQHQNLNKGWTWMSMYVEPEQGHRKVEDIFTQGNYVKTLDGYSEAGEASTWSGTLKGDLDASLMYMVKSDSVASFNIRGHRLNDKDVEIKLYEGWNWIGYTPFESMSLQAALSDLEPVEGDIIKSQKSFAQYTKLGWIGNLTVLAPGEGYIYYNASGSMKTFTYPERYSATYKVQSPQRQKALAPALAAYPLTMNMVVSVERDGITVSDGTLMAIAGRECREVQSSLPYPDGTPLPLWGGAGGEAYWMSIHGNTACENFNLVYYDAEAGLYYVGQDVMNYAPNTVLGTAENPVHFELSASAAYSSLDEAITAITSLRTEDGQGEAYDLLGRRVNNTAAQGVYIKKGQKILVK